MKKDAPKYFTHDYNARNDIKMQAILQTKGMEGIGIFWCIIEMLYEENGKLPIEMCDCIANALRTHCDLVRSIIFDFKLFKNDDVFFWSDAVNERIAIRKEKSESARMSALTRYKHANACERTANVPSRTAIKGKEIKEKVKENKKEKDISAFAAPSLLEVQNFVKEKNLCHIDPESFIAFYESKGWLVGKSKMKNWRAAAVGWDARDKKNNLKNKPIEYERRYL